MKKNILSLVIALSTFFMTASYAEEYVENKQKNYDAYTTTNMVECFKYNGNLIDKGKYFTGTVGGECIVFKNMDFGRHGAVNVELSYAVKGNYNGVLEFRKGSLTGELIAEFQTKNNNNRPTKKTAEVEFPAVASGRFDLYVLIKNDTFGNLYTFKFNKTPTAYQTISAVDSLKDYIGFADADFLDTGISVNCNNPDLLGRDYARHLDYYVSFENKIAKEVVIDTNVEIGGRMRIYDNCPDGEMLQEITLLPGNVKQIFEASDAIKNLSATQNLFFAFDNDVRLEFNSFSFTAEPKLNIEETTFDTSNESSYGGGVTENEEFFGGTADGKAYICWEDVDFGETAWPMIATLTYGVGVANNGAYANIRIDSATGPVIASIPMPMKTGGGWESQMTEKSVVSEDVTGIHDMYVTVDGGEYTYGAKAGNIFSIDFDVIKEKYGISYNVLSENSIPKELNTKISFLNAEDNPASLLYAFALYDETGKLISADFKAEDVSEGLNVFERSLNYKKELEEKGYYVKYFVWNTNYKPIISDTLDRYNIE